MRWFIIFLVWVSASAAGAQDAAKSLVLFDFDQGDFHSMWTSEKITARTGKPPQTAKGQGLLPIGMAAQIDAQRGGRLKGTPNQVPRDWLTYHEISFWVFRSQEEVKRLPTLTFEVVAVESDDSAHFWRRVDVTTAGWQPVTLPLKWFRQEPGAGVRWDRIGRIEFRFRDEAHLWIDSVALRLGKSKTAAYANPEDLRNLAFSASRPDDVRILETEFVTIVTDVKNLDLVQLGDHLKKVSDKVYSDLAFLEKPLTPPSLVVFSTREKYQAFPASLGKRLNAQTPVPQSGGYTIGGIATSYWDPAQGTLRPVYTHEFIHALLERSIRLGNKGEWFHEGFANYYQLQFHPQKNFGEIVSQGMRNANMHTPLRELTSGASIGGDRYWQAVTIIDTLLSVQEFRSHLADLVKAFQKSRSTGLPQHLQQVLKVDWMEFEKVWRKRCSEAYAQDRK